MLLEDELPSGSSLPILLARLAARYARFDEAIYDPQGDVLRGAVILTNIGRLMSPAAALDLALQSEESVALIPAYSGV